MASLRLIIPLAAALLAAVAAGAQETPPATRAVEVRFVPPGADGTVSLGIYSAAGKLVRVLCDEWPFDRFSMGRDALSTTWDGLDADGRPVPPGVYDARGFIVGGVDVRGEAFHFNDWIDEAGSPRIVAVPASQLLPGGDILLAARLAGANAALVRYSPESDVRWHTVVKGPRPQPAQSVQLAVSDTMAFVLLDGHLQAAQLADGAEVALPVDKSGIRAMAARGACCAVLGTSGLKFYALPDFAPRGDAGALPADLVSLALLEDGAVAAAADGSVWMWRAGWSRLGIPVDVRVLQVAGGRGPTFWALQAGSDGVRSVAQYSPEDGRLSEWTPRAEDGEISSVSAAVENDYFVAALAAPDMQRTVAIRRQANGEGWQYVFDKKITASSGFGWADGKLSASSSELPEEMKVPLAENPLDSSASRHLTIRAGADDTGTVLTTTDGLPLLRVSSEPGFGRVMLVPGAAANTARFFQGDGACVEEYSISKIDDITAFDAGPIEMTGSGEAPPAPAVEPEVEEVPPAPGGQD